MSIQTTTISRSMAPQAWNGPAGSIGQGRFPREQWIAMCAGRLRQLGVNRTTSAIALLASGLWNDVAMYDPCIAAELEYESGMSDS